MKPRHSLASEQAQTASTTSTVGSQNHAEVFPSPYIPPPADIRPSDYTARPQLEHSGRDDKALSVSGVLLGAFGAR
jgi:hypothetical protein